MGRRAATVERFRDGLVGPRLECTREFLQKPGNVIVERRDVEMLRRWELPHLLPPPREQGVALLPDERRQFVEFVDGHVVSTFTPGWRV